MRKTGVFSWYGYYADYRQRIEKIKNAGFDGIMIWWEDESGDWPISRFEMAERAKELELELFNIHMAGTDDNAIWNESKETRERHLIPICKTMEEIADIGCFNLVLHLCERGDVPDPSIHLLHSIERLLPCAEANNITLSLENTWRADYCTYVWNAFPGVKELGFCFDTSHANLKDQFYLLEQYGDRLSALHIADNDTTADQHRIPFDGNIDFREKVLPFLTDNDLPFTMELIADRKMYPEENAFLQKAYERDTDLIRFTEELRAEQEETRQSEKKPKSFLDFSI